MKLFFRKDLITRLNNKEPAAQAKIYAQFRARIFDFIRHLIKNDQDADDLTADTFYKLLEHKGQFENITKVQSFLYITARNASLDYLKHQKRIGKREDDIKDYFLSDLEKTIDQAMEAAELRNKIRDAIEKLPPKCKQVFLLFYLQNLSNEQIALKLSITEKTVSNQLSLAKKLLKNTLGKINQLSFPVFMAMGYYSSFHFHFS